jgi:molybdenum cofactor cytidylyltransferase
MSTSIRQGLLALDEKTEAFFVVLGDQPGISKEILNQLVHEFKRTQSKKSIVLPTYHGSRGHPVLFHIQYKKEALKLKGDVGCRQILEEHPEDILEMETDVAAILDDLDTPEDYREHLKHKA